MTVCFVRNWSAVELVPLSTDQPTVLNDDDEEEHGHDSGPVSDEDGHSCDDSGLVLQDDEIYKTKEYQANLSVDLRNLNFWERKMI